MESAHNQNLIVLITGVGSFLGVSLAKSYLTQNYMVYGIGNSHILQPLLTDKNFTLLELDLAQPLPAYLPKFNIIFHLDILLSPSIQASPFNHISPQLKNLTSLAKETNARLFTVAPLTTGRQQYDFLETDEATQEQVKLVLVGDIYGPHMPLHNLEDNELSKLIKQAKESDKVIMEDEGLKIIYPTNIADAVFALNKFAISAKCENIEYIVSDEPLTSLSAAYEIQTAAALTLDKEINLYFTGPQPEAKTQLIEPIKINNLNYTPKVDLKNGLRATFEAFSSQHESKKHQEPQDIAPNSQIQNKVDSLGGKKDELRSGIQKLGHLTSRFPRNSKLIRSKRFALVLVAILVIFVVKTGLDLYLASHSLKLAKQAIKEGKIDNAKKSTNKAASSIKAASYKIGIVIYPFSKLKLAPAQAVSIGLSGMVDTADSLVYFLDGASEIRKELAQIAAKDSKDEKIDQESIETNFKQAYFLSSIAHKKLLIASHSIFKNFFEKSDQEVVNLSNIANSSLELSRLLTNLTGTDSPKTYLLLLENNAELRPGGGFIGNYGLIEFDKGKIKNISVEDIYTIDGQLKEKIAPPPQLKDKLGIDRFYLRDSNWNGDFPLNSQLARDFYKKETGKDVDGVIAIDLSFLSNYLSKIGPTKLEDYNEEISSQNLFERGEYHSEVGFFPGSTQKKDFFAALSRKLISDLVTGIQDPTNSSSSWLALIETIKQGLEEKHIMATIDDPTIALFLSAKSWNRPMPPNNFNPQDDSTETRDFLGLVEANIGANKINRFLDREINYEMTIGRDADLIATAKITYNNKSQAETWPGGKYVNYLRIGVPFAIDVTAYKNGDKTDIKDVEIINNANFSYLSMMVEVPPNSTKEVMVSYRIHKSIKLEKTPIYHLYIEKQAGTDKDPIRFTFNLPSYLEVKNVNGNEIHSGKENISIESDLTTDREFKIEINKK